MRQNEEARLLKRACAKIIHANGLLDCTAVKIVTATNMQRARVCLAEAIQFLDMAAEEQRKTIRETPAHARGAYRRKA